MTMKRTQFFPCFVILSLLAFSVVVAAEGAISKPDAILDTCNVVWDSPSRDSNGSMPLGNGDIGVNAWVEPNGDLVFFISKTDAWTDSGRLVKLGLVRVRLDPPLDTTHGFRQELKLRKGCIEIRSQKSEVRSRKSEVRRQRSDTTCILTP